MAGVGAGAIPIVGLDGSASTAIVVNLIFSSLWMGALGWELLMSVSFDYRLLTETRWRSVMSSAHSIAYLLSRYATLTFIALYVAANAMTAPDMAHAQCRQRVAASAVFFVISQSSIILIFVMRTLALWNLDVRIVTLLTVAWLAMVGLELTMPIKANGAIVNGFCTWSIDGFWVGASMTSLAIVSVLCMVLTIFKLNKQGWRGVVKSVLPRKTYSIDSEEVSAMLVQRTTIFSIILVAVIALADVVYFSTTLVVYQLMTVTAYLAIASSLAGRIFRRSWKLTRSSYYQHPPSYFPEWVTPKDMLLDAQSQSYSHAHTQPRKSDDSLTFVEGEFRSGPSSSAKSLILPLREKDKTPAQLFADQHGRALSDGALDDPTITKSDPSYDTFSALPSQDTALKIQRSQTGRGMSEPSIYERDYAMSKSDGGPSSPNMAALESSEKTWRISRGRNGSASRLVLPFGARDQLFGNEKGKLRRPQTDPTGEHQFDMRAAMHSGWTVRPATTNSPGVSPKQVVDTLYADEEADAKLRAGNATTTQREDLVAGPSRPRLWLDSSAERARMEAATSLGLTLTAEAEPRKSPYAPSYASSSHQSIPSSAHASRRELAARRSVRRPSALSNNVGPLDDEGVKALDSSSTSTSRPSTAGVAPRSAGRLGSPTEGARRGSFLESPAIVQQGISPVQKREAYDIDAIRQSLSTATQKWRPSTAGSVTNTGKGADVVSRPSFSLPSTPNGAEGRDADHVIAVGEGSTPRTQVLRSSAALQSSLRPSTAPDQAEIAPARGGTEGRRGSAGASTSTSMVAPSTAATQDASTAADALAAFRQVVEGDNESNARTVDASRPRTSRGGPLGTFGELRRDSNTSSTEHEESSTARPTTSDGSQMVVKPFGSGVSTSVLKRQLSSHGLPSSTAATEATPHPPQALSEPGLSAIEQQYRKLAAYVEADEASLAEKEK